jgi:hypothetical protein
MRHSGLDLLLGQPLGQRDLDRPVERQDSLVHLGQRAVRRLHAEMAADHRSAEPFASHLDLLGQRNLLLPRQEGDFSHLAQIEPDRIVAPLGEIGRIEPFDVRIDRHLAFSQILCLRLDSGGWIGG